MVAMYYRTHCVSTAENDCRFDYNQLQGLCHETSDCGAFYTGRSWLGQGNIITDNSFQNILSRGSHHGASVKAIFLADQVGHPVAAPEGFHQLYAHLTNKNALYDY